MIGKKTKEAPIESLDSAGGVENIIKDSLTALADKVRTKETDLSVREIVALQKLLAEREKADVVSFFGNCVSCTFVADCGFAGKAEVCPYPGESMLSHKDVVDSLYGLLSIQRDRIAQCLAAEKSKGKTTDKTSQEMSLFFEMSEKLNNVQRDPNKPSIEINARGESAIAKLFQNTLPSTNRDIIVDVESTAIVGNKKIE